MPPRIDTNNSINNGLYAAPAVGAVTLLKAADFDNAIANTTGPVAVEFMNYVCGHCVAAQPMLEDVAKALGNRMTVFQVEIHESPELFRRFRIAGTPTFIMFKDGQRVGDPGMLSAITPYEIRKTITAPFQR